MRTIIFLLMQNILNINSLLGACFCFFDIYETCMFLISSIAFNFHYRTELWRVVFCFRNILLLFAIVILIFRIALWILHQNILKQPHQRYQCLVSGLSNLILRVAIMVNRFTSHVKSINDAQSFLGVHFFNRKSLSHRWSELTWWDRSALKNKVLLRGHEELWILHIKELYNYTFFFLRKYDNWIEKICPVMEKKSVVGLIFMPVFDGIFLLCITWKGGRGDNSVIANFFLRNPRNQCVLTTCFRGLLLRTTKGLDWRVC